MMRSRYTREPAHPFDYFRFADKESLAAARKAWRLIKHQPKEPQLFVVTGPYRSGKSLFVRTIIEAAFPMMDTALMQWELMPASARGHVLGEAALRGFLHLECRDHKLFRSQDILAFSTCRGWSWRRPRTYELLTARNRCAIFLTAADLTLAPDLAARAHVITMQPFEETAAAVMSGNSRQPV